MNDPMNRELRPKWVLAVVCVSALIVNLDNTILNVALPTLVRKLDATSSDLQWIVDSYAMVFAGLLLVGGSLADRFGRKRLFLVGLAIFAGGSIGAALSGSVEMLIGWRAVMGAGAAMTIPSSLSILNDVFREPTARARAIGAWGGTIGLGIAIGPIAGGALLANFWWGSIFLVNVPIVVAGFVAALVLVPDSKNPSAASADTVGAFLSIAGLGLMLWAIIEAPTKGLDVDQKCSASESPASSSSPPSSAGKLAVTTRCSTSGSSPTVVSPSPPQPSCSEPSGCWGRCSCSPSSCSSSSVCRPCRPGSASCPWPACWSPVPLSLRSLLASSG